MGKKLFELKLKFYAALVENKPRRARKLRRKMLKQEVLMNMAGKSFKPHHIVT